MKDFPSIELQSVSNLPKQTIDPDAAEVGNGSPTQDSPTGSRQPSVVVPAITPVMRQKGRIQFLTLCWTLALAGWTDGSTGPLLPRIQSVYHVGDAIVSLIFIANTIGFVLGAFLNVILTERFGFGKVIVLGSMCQTIGLAISTPAPPFPALAVGYAINGFGVALQDAQANGFVASLKTNASSLMGILHAAYGIGAFAAPLAATQFAGLPRWSFHYLVGLGISLLNTVALIAVFRFKTQDEAMMEAGEGPAVTSESQDSKFKQIMTTKLVYLLAFFALVYVGSEVTLGGWTVTFVRRQRGGGPSSGYISSGFFGGLTLGRVLLLKVNSKVGEWRVIFLYTAIAVGLQITIWFVPSLIENAVAVSFIGLVLGPMYPILMNQSARILAPWILTGAVGFIAGLGQAGSALLPFATGALASRFGISSLQPFMVAMFGLLGSTWFFVPRLTKRWD